MKASEKYLDNVGNYTQKFSTDEVETYGELCRLEALAELDEGLQNYHKILLAKKNLDELKLKLGL